MNASGIFILYSLLFPAAVAAEDPGVLEIKKLYAETAAAIALAQQGEPGGLYCNELTVNSRNGSWRAVGNYSERIAFWYSDQPEFTASAGGDGKAALAKVEVSETAAARSWYREFFFAGGRLLFFFRRENNGDEIAAEERIYFKEGKPLQRLLGRERATGPIIMTSIFLEAARWQELFLLTFGD
jgi:hypothetical protein